MTESDSFVDNLMRRRVPQFVGMYVAATWLVIELGDWITDRFDLPASLTTYVFVGLLTMLPAVILFSFNHGAPGKDQWTRTERVAISLNAVLAALVLYLLSPLLVVEAATETVQIPDETGAIQEFEVAKQGYHRELVGFFWRNESGSRDLDWLSYGLPLMLAHDLNRVSPVITVVTPFSSSAIRNELSSKGYAALIDEPRGLRVNIARDRRSAALIVGSFSEIDGNAIVSATLIDAADGSEIGSHEVSNLDWLAAVDNVSAAILGDLGVEPGEKHGDEPVGQHLSNSLQAIEHFTNGQVALNLNNDYPQGIEEFETAVALDPGFAEASGELSMTHYLNNDVEAAREAASLALRNDYRLSETSKFVLKANRYIFEGDFDRAVRVVEVWTRVQPNSTEAFAAMARINRILGTEESLQKAGDAYDRLLALNPADYGVYRQRAELEQQRGNFAAAADYLQQFLDLEPDNGDAHIQIASVYQALGDLGAAQDALEDAAILSDSPLESELGLARLEARRGLFHEAEERLRGQLDVDLQPEQRVDVLSVLAEIAMLRGQIEKTIELHGEINEIAREYMPPMVRLVGIENQLATLLSLLGRYDEAIGVADAITAQLQPPIDAYMYFAYTTIYEAAGDRRAYRDVVENIVKVRDQLPPLFQPFVEMQLARVAIWDGEPETALPHLGRAGEFLDQSFIQVVRNNLGTSILHIMLAELYLEAHAIDEARERVEKILGVFPANGMANLTNAKISAAADEPEEARESLGRAMAVWADADADFIVLEDARSLLESLPAVSEQDE